MWRVLKHNRIIEYHIIFICVERDTECVRHAFRAFSGLLVAKPYRKSAAIGAQRRKIAPWIKIRTDDTIDDGLPVRNRRTGNNVYRSRKIYSTSITRPAIEGAILKADICRRTIHLLGKRSNYAQNKQNDYQVGYSHQPLKYVSL